MRNHSALRSHRSVSNAESGLETPKLRSVFDVAHRTGHFDRFLRDTCIIHPYYSLIHLVRICLFLLVFNIWITPERAAFFFEKCSNQCLAREQSEKAVCEH